MYMGLKIVSGSPYSFHVLDYGVYSPSDPGSDAADDSTRYKMTALPGFDNSLTVGVNGSIYNLKCRPRDDRPRRTPRRSASPMSGGPRWLPCWPRRIRADAR